MTQAPILDILITRTITVTREVPYVSAFRYAAGQWWAGADTLDLDRLDADGLALPDAGTVPEGTFTLAKDTQTYRPFMLTSYREGRTALNHPDPDTRRLAAEGVGAFLDRYAGPLRMMLGPMEATRTVTEPQPQTVWAARLDFRGRDFVQSATTGPVTIEDSRYVVRDDQANPWAVDDEFRDETGQRRTVKGVGRMGRNRHLELLARRVG